MKKAKIGRRILDAISEEEYLRRSKLNPETVQSMTEDTAVIKDGHVYPVTKQYSDVVPGVCDCGPVLLYSRPDTIDSNDEYKEESIIDSSLYIS